MAEYSIRIKKSAVRELKRIPKTDLRRIVTRINGLAKDLRPDGCRKLSGGELYRIRQGNYRIVYTVEDAVLTVCVVKSGNRKNVYR